MSATSSDSDDCADTVVLDNGSHRIKSGFSGEKTCCCVFNNVIGYGKTKDSYVGEDAMSRRDILDISCPLQYGVVSNWDNMEKIWDSMFKQYLRVDSNEQGVLITEPPFNPKSNREKIANVMFEQFSIPDLQVVNPCQLVLYASGRTTGAVIDIGESVTSIIAFYEGIQIIDSIKRNDLAGRDINLYLQKLLYQNGYSFTSFNEIENLRDIKHRHCYCASIKGQRHKKHPEISESYTLPDGEIIEITEEMLECPEVLFDPSILGYDSIKGVDKLLVESIAACDIDIKKDVSKSIILSGATTLLRNFKVRLGDEVHESISDAHIIAPPERNKSVWIGGSILSSLSCYNDLKITKSQYEELGPTVVHRYGYSI